LFDSLVAPILLYGSDVWSVNVTSEVEKIHIKSSPNAAVLGELGRFPMAIKCKERVLKFWTTFF
jgi:hypothetical protein